MLRIQTTTGLSPEDVIKQAKNYFVPMGLKVKAESPTAVYMEGGGGGLDVEATVEKNKTTVDFVSTEWDKFVQEFIDTIYNKKAAKKK